MPSMEIPQSELLPVPGVRLYACEANIRYRGRHDLSVIEIAEGASVSAMFTRNKFCAAPVQLAREHLAARQAKDKTYLLINAGNANAGTGKPGYLAAQASCDLLAQRFSVTSSQVLPFSTGVIGQHLDLSRFEQAFSSMTENSLQQDKWRDVAEAILTTDTCAKAKSLTLDVQGQSIHFTGIAKGSGMIKPDMATMLSYIACDASIEQSVLDEVLAELADESFNCISVDGDTSTNDAVVLIATGASGISIEQGSEAMDSFRQALRSLMVFLAQAIVKDGEGATKFIEINVKGGKDSAECKEVAYTIAHSPLVKTAFFASDPNWGRILAALGRASVIDLDIGKVDIYLGQTALILAGELAESYTEALGQKEMKPAEIHIGIDLHRGKASAKVWTCDFSYDYVKINAEYRS